VLFYTLVKIITISMMVFSFYIPYRNCFHSTDLVLDIKTGIFILPPRGMGEPFTLNGHTTIYCSSPVSISKNYCTYRSRFIPSLKLPLINDRYSVRTYRCFYGLCPFIITDRSDLWVENRVILQGIEDGIVSD
jgi:hypothetical protein